MKKDQQQQQKGRNFHIKCKNKFRTYSDINENIERWSERNGKNLHINCSLLLVIKTICIELGWEGYEGTTK